MSGEIIRKGDPTSHGGTVLEGSLHDICHGKPIAYIGHKVHCPKCGGDFPIIEGVLTTTFYGQGVAIAGMKTSCGATLIPTQATDVVEYSGGAAAGAASVIAGPAAMAAGLAAAANSATGVGADSINPKRGDKVIKQLFWTYGPDEVRLSDASRHYVDLNLHVETENYAPGETVQIMLENDDGSEVVMGRQTIALDAVVGADGTAKIMNVFQAKTLEIGLLG